ncbi:MAG: hypothetical protein HBSAPP02_30770 [Phycisphaerae bacterium]|nr:MAG: hypothetical protein HBSAPP02_30770 [Phycisphaerae bacterium]
MVDAAGVIVCGHTRWRAAQKLGLTEVPVHVATDLTPDQVRAYRIADNKTAELAEWNLELLPIELAELKDAGITWSLLGFDADELAMLLYPGVKPGLTDPDDVPEPPDAAVTQPGDLWLLGDRGDDEGSRRFPRSPSSRQIPARGWAASSGIPAASV